jgi:hypothetical protein
VTAPICDVRFSPKTGHVAASQRDASGTNLDWVGRRSSFGSLAKLVAIRRASSLASRLVAERFGLRLIQINMQRRAQRNHSNPATGKPFRRNLKNEEVNVVLGRCRNHPGHATFAVDPQAIHGVAMMT